MNSFLTIVTASVLAFSASILQTQGQCNLPLVETSYEPFSGSCGLYCDVSSDVVASVYTSSDDNSAIKTFYLCIGIPLLILTVIFGLDNVSQYWQEKDLNQGPSPTTTDAIRIIVVAYFVVSMCLILPQFGNKSPNSDYICNLDENSVSFGNPFNGGNGWVFIMGILLFTSFKLALLYTGVLSSSVAYRLARPLEESIVSKKHIHIGIITIVFLLDLIIFIASGIDADSSSSVAYISFDNTVLLVICEILPNFLFLIVIIPTHLYAIMELKKELKVLLVAKLIATEVSSLITRLQLCLVGLGIGVGYLLIIELYYAGESTQFNKSKNAWIDCVSDSISNDEYSVAIGDNCHNLLIDDGYIFPSVWVYTGLPIFIFLLLMSIFILTCHSRRKERFAKVANAIGITIDMVERVDYSNINPIIALPGAIEQASEQYSSQTMMSKYFLTFLGCKSENLWPIIGNNSEYKDKKERENANANEKTNDNENKNENKNENEKGKEKESEKKREEKSENYEISDNIGILDSDKANEIMNGFVETIIRLLEQKVPISQDMLMLSFFYCKHFNKELEMKLIDTLEVTSKECLSYDNKDSNTKTRDEAWFRNHLQSSNVWVINRTGFENNENSEKKEERDNNNNNEIGLLFDVIGDTIEDTLQFQRKMIYDCINEERAHCSQSWQTLSQFTKYMLEEKQIKVFNKAFLDLGNPLRQDAPGIDIISPYSGDYLETIKTQSPNYDTLNEFNIKGYLTQCLVIAHGLDLKFQQSMQNVLTLMDTRLEYQAAPVKTEHRCIIKANTDYANEKFPSVANICDFIRCSVTAPNSDILLESIEAFIKAVGNGETEHITNVVRIKNGFETADEWKPIGSGKDNLRQYGYFDIKLNVVIEDKFARSKIKSDGAKQGIRMIGEIQFLLKSLLKSKKIGHKVYAIERQKEYFGAVSSKTDIGVGKSENLDVFSDNLTKLISKKDYLQFCKELLLKPNMAVAIGKSKHWQNLFEKDQKCNKMYNSALIHWTTSFVAKKKDN